MRELIVFPCEGDTLAGTLDDAGGAHRAADRVGRQRDTLRRAPRHGVARGRAGGVRRAGVPLRPARDRRFGRATTTAMPKAGPTSPPPLQSFRTVAPQVKRIVGFGNCDAATALALFHRDAGIESLVLANPWVGDEERRPAPRRGDPLALCRPACRIRSNGCGWRRAGSISARRSRGCERLLPAPSEYWQSDRRADGGGARRHPATTSCWRTATIPRSASPARGRMAATSANARPTATASRGPATPRGWRRS